MKLIRKLIVGISTICLLVMTFVSSTYAWFQINSRASVENFHFEVHGGQGFLVSIDNVNYYNDLTLLQLQKAMLVAYGAGEYRLATDGSETLYHVTYEDAYDAEGHYDPREVLVPIEDNNLGGIINGRNGIQLLPTTTQNGRDLMDSYNSITNVSSGRYVQFSVYFKTTSDNKNDKFAYEIFLNGEEGKADDGSILEPTKITSQETEVTLSADMNVTIPNTEGVKKVYSRKKSLGDKIKVYSSNAIRLSITDQEYFEEYKKDDQNNDVLDENGNKVIANSGYKLVSENSTIIYELNDTVNKNTDLGSYATNYTGNYTSDELDAMITNSGTLVENEELALYCSNFNAMYTYYNNLKPDAKLTDRLLDYNTVKNMRVVRDLSGQDAITTVKSGDKPKLLTFRIWLEGWDADCFDGLKKSVDMKLAFGSRRLNIA